MSARSANVTSIDALRNFRAALLTFDDEVDGALTTLELESRRVSEWIENERPQYWAREEHRAANVLAESRINLQRCLLTKGEQGQSCVDEKKDFERAKRRQQTIEDKVKAVRRWKPIVRKEVEEFLVQIARLRHFLETDFPQGVAALERMATALEDYTRRTAPAAEATGHIATTADGGTSGGAS